MLRAVFIALMILPSAANAMDISFSWGDTPACNTGWPDIIDSPAFELVDVPEGTKKLKFVLKDKDAPGFSHGGGTVSHQDSAQVPAGAFTYKGPCPPNGQHRYVWTVTALDRYGDKVGKASAMRLFPEE